MRIFVKIPALTSRRFRIGGKMGKNIFAIFTIKTKICWMYNKKYIEI